MTAFLSLNISGRSLSNYVYVIIMGNPRTVFLRCLEEAGRKLIRNFVTTYRSTRRHAQEGLTPLRSLKITQIFSIVSQILSTVSLTSSGNIYEVRFIPI